MNGIGKEVRKSGWSKIDMQDEDKGKEGKHILRGGGGRAVI